MVELKSIVQDFTVKLDDMRGHLNSDMQKVMDRQTMHSQLQQ